MAELSIDVVARFAKFSEAMERVSRDAEKSAGRVEHAFGKLEKLFALVGIGIGVKELIEFTKHSIEVVDQLGKLSQRTGIAVESLSGLRYAAALADVNFEELTIGLQKFNVALDKGSPAFKRLGVDLSGLKTPEEKLQAVAQAFAETNDGAAKTAVSIELFGKAGAKLIPLLNGGAEGLQKFREEAEKLGVLYNAEQAKRAEEFNDNLRRAKFAAEAFAVAMGNLALPALTKFLDEMLRGKEIFGSFGAALVNIGIGINPFNNATENVTKYRAQLVELRKERERLAVLDARPGTSALSRNVFRGQITDIDEAIATAEKKLKFVEFQQRALALGGQSDADLDARDLQLRQQQRAKEKRDIAPDPKDQLPITRAKLQAAVAAAQQLAQQQEEIENIAFARGERTLQVHYDKLTSIAQSGIKKRLAATNEAITEEEGERDKFDKGTPERIQHEAVLIKLESERALLQKQYAFVAVANAEKLKDAENAYRDQIIDTNAQIQEQAGFLEKAVIARQNERKHLQERDRLVSEEGPKSKAVEDFDARDKEERQKARINELLKDEETQRERTTTQIEIADQARQAQAGSLDAEIKFLQDRNRLLRDSIPLEQARIDKLETEAALQPAGPARDDFIAQIAARKAALEKTKQATEGAATALEEYGLRERKLGVIFQEEQTAEQDIQNLRAAGAITTQESLERTDAVRRRYVVALRAQLEAEQALAKERPFDDELRARIESTRAAINRLEATSDQVGKQMRDTFQAAFTDPFIDLINHTKSADQALKSFFNNIIQSLLRLETQKIGESIFGKSGGLDSLFKTASGFLGFGGGAGAAGATQTAAPITFSSAMGNVLTPGGPMILERFARGGIARRPTLSLFGEGRMPEAYVPLPDGRSIPVTMRGAESGTRVQAGPSAITGWQRATAPAVTLQLHPDAMHMTLRDWLEGELARTLATR